MSQTLAWYKGTPEYCEWFAKLVEARGCSSAWELIELLAAEESIRCKLPPAPPRTLPRGGAKPGSGRPRKIASE